MVPRAGLEPARFSAKVFETFMSTNSITWANISFKGPYAPYLSRVTGKLFHLPSE